MTSTTIISPSAEISASSTIGEGCQVWDLSQIREGAKIGRDCVVGRGVYIGIGVVIGENTKIQNSALIYEPAVVEDWVFIGPAVVFTNDTYPRAVNPDGTKKNASDWLPVGVTVHRGASIGARAVCVAPVTIGQWAMIAAGATVIKDVPDFALVGGTPARQLGWVGKAGVQLISGSRDGEWICPVTQSVYIEQGGKIREEVS
ncbi:MAG: N-acetyltransferase [Propionibacteriaceae bacterium]|nr:N-acetyltransferase [Propionibacteriaceae bacterium]